MGQGTGRPGIAMTAKPSGRILRFPDPASGDRTPPRVFDPFDPDPRILDPYPGATSSREESAETWIQGEIESIYDRADACLILNDGETLSPTQHRLLLLAGLAQRTTLLKPDPLYTLAFCIKASPIDAATPIARPPAGPVCDGRRLTIGTVRRHLRYLEGQGMLKLLACSVPQSADPYDEIGDQTLAIIDFRPLLERGEEIERQVAKCARDSHRSSLLINALPAARRKLRELGDALDDDACEMLRRHRDARERSHSLAEKEQMLQDIVDAWNRCVPPGHPDA
jgi:hypothetical protein